MVKDFNLTYCSVYLYMFIIWYGTEVHSISRNYTTRTRTIPSNYKFRTNNAVDVTTTPSKVSGKWQVGRVSRKQYEIINMLHRKMITFLETESTSAAIHNSNNLSKIRGQFSKNKLQVTVPPQKPLQESFEAVHPRPNDRPSTPSYIEFYYLDESDDRANRKSSIPKNSRFELQSDEYKAALLRPPFFLFRVNDETCKPTTLQYMQSSYHNNKHFSSHNPKEVEKSKEKHYFYHKFASKNENKIEMKHKTNTTEDKRSSFLLGERFTPLVSRTAYDRIKFFEIYDSETYKPRRSIDNKTNMINNNNIHSKEKVFLDHVVHNVNHDGNNITRFVKKHANYDFKENTDFISQVGEIRKSTSKTKEMARKTFTELSRPANWSDFPFVAVYIYEPMQIRCESASISPHWLVASATCLYRQYRNRNNVIEGRSAYVAYCGNSWRLPARIAYVKRSFVHPRFQAKDKTRRYLYNIGVIQVINSMANTCSGWRPTSLMSHQFVAERGGAFATAVGWGLDSKMKMLNGESVKNLYCLSLPAYTLEKNDTVHGGLLLIGGKLIALYLQEEHRPWGVQSALYTGIWRHISWLLDVAREEDLETFAIDM
ncbi:uncharacterized protein LOC123866615 isoform X2 [Maniola jurtina]|uniref:uncharacterized protein LOC123866615 isoform X2 n=1 Tax=Maniola jurtina TaxID=191418 RepID=UPI001E68FCED|nr:uncharacterized protein LOC123866615 isoform X2 [Maniola jurtina]